MILSLESGGISNQTKGKRCASRQLSLSSFIYFRLLWVSAAARGRQRLVAEQGLEGAWAQELGCRGSAALRRMLSSRTRERARAPASAGGPFTPGPPGEFLTFTFRVDLLVQNSSIPSVPTRLFPEWLGCGHATCFGSQNGSFKRCVSQFSP